MAKINTYVLSHILSMMIRICIPIYFFKSLGLNHIIDKFSKKENLLRGVSGLAL